MKKMLKSALALAMGAVMLMPVTAFAAEDELPSFLLRKWL